MFMIVFVSQDIIFDNDEIIKFKVKFKTLNVLIFNVTIVATITIVAKIDMIFLNYDVLCSRTNRRIVNSTTFFFKLKKR